MLYLYTEPHSVLVVSLIVWAQTKPARALVNKLGQTETFEEYEEKGALVGVAELLVRAHSPLPAGPQ